MPVDSWDFFDYIYCMARPKKDPAMRMDTDLRIPLTNEQKALIDEAVATDPEGKASWARAILLRAAKSQLARAKDKKA
jgi:hypothetical protein